MEHAADLKAFEEQLQAGTPPHALEGFSRIHAHENALEPQGKCPVAHGHHRRDDGEPQGADDSLRRIDKAVRREAAEQAPPQGRGLLLLPPQPSAFISVEPAGAATQQRRAGAPQARLSGAPFSGFSGFTESMPLVRSAKAPRQSFSDLRNGSRSLSAATAADNRPRSSHATKDAASRVVPAPNPSRESQSGETAPDIPRFRATGSRSCRSR